MNALLPTLKAVAESESSSTSNQSDHLGHQKGGGGNGGGNYDSQFGNTSEVYSDAEQYERFADPATQINPNAGIPADDEVMVEEDEIPPGQLCKRIFGEKNARVGAQQYQRYMHRDEPEDSDEEMNNYGEEMGRHYDGSDADSSDEEMRHQFQQKNKIHHNICDSRMFRNKLDFRMGRDSQDGPDTYGEENEDDYDDRFDNNDDYDIPGRGFANRYKFDALDDHIDYSSIYHKQKSKPAPEMPSIVDTEKPYILYLDSLNRVNPVNMQCLRQYIEMEYMDKKLKSNPQMTNYLSAAHNWPGLTTNSMPHYQPQVPTQKNYTDCGLYLLENAESFIRDPKFI